MCDVVTAALHNFPVLLGCRQLGTQFKGGCDAGETGHVNVVKWTVNRAGCGKSKRVIVWRGHELPSA